MSQIYLFAGGASSPTGEKQQEDPFTAKSPVRSKWNFLTVVTAVMLFWCLGSFNAFAQTTYYSKAAATDFTDVNSWGTATDGTGTAPAAISNADNFIVANSAALTLSGNATVRQLTINAGSLTIGANTLTVSKAGAFDSSFVVNTGGSLTLGGTGLLAVNGNVLFASGSTFIQTGGTLSVDGNNGGGTTGSVASGTPLFAIGTSATTYATGTMSLTGGKIIIVDPHAATTSTQSFYVALATNAMNITAGLNHTIQMGDGVSTDAGGNAVGFNVDMWVSTGALKTGNYVINTLGGTNRHVTQAYKVIVGGNLTVTSGELRFTVTGPYNVAGNIYVDTNATLTTSVTLVLGDGSYTSSTALTNSPSLVPQTVSGPGTFRNSTTTTTANFASLGINNTSAAGVTLNALSSAGTQPANSISVSGTLTFLAGKATTAPGSQAVLGISGTVGTLSYTSGGFTTGSVFGRWYNAGSTGTSFTAGSDATSATSRYPFVNAAGQGRSGWIERTTPTAIGLIAMTYNESAGYSTVALSDAGTPLDIVGNDSWALSILSGTAASASVKVQFQAPGMFGGPLASASTRVVQGSTFVGTHQNGTVTPGGQRTGISLTDLVAAPFQLAISSADIPYVSIASGDWNNAATWNKGTVPGCTDVVNIADGHTVTVNSAANTAKNVAVAATGTLVIASGDLTVGCTSNNASFTNNGTLTVSGGTLNINGNMVHAASSTFNQSGGNINVDGNNGGDTATSVASGTALVAMNSSNVNWTGGMLTVVDPHAATTATNAVTYSNTGNANATAMHTLRFGNGVSTDAGGNAAGFRINTFSSSGRLSLGNLQLSTLGGTNRLVTTSFSMGVNGNVTIDAGSEFRDSGNALHVSGNVVNNGTYVGTSTLAFQSFLNGTAAAVANAQSLSGSGTFANAATAPTANLVSLTVNNSAAAGVTLNVPVALSGTLTLTSGVVNTTTANLLTVQSTSGTAVTGGSMTAYVNGPLARTIASGNAATNFINFPVGRGMAYAPIALAPVTTAATVIKAEAFDTNTGTANASIINLANNRRWETSVGSGTVTSTNVRIGDANLVDGKIPVTAPSAAGEYTSTFGSLATFAPGTAPAVPTVTANAGIPIANYSGFVSYANSNVCTGTPAPGLTIASTNNICAGATVNLSVENITTGSGVSYQWQSSADGIAYADVDSATSATLTVTPTANTYYQLKVTCSAGPSTGTSTPILVAFANSVVTTTPAARCGLGTVTLGATPSVGATIAWFDAATNGNLIGTGNSFTTPSISANTTYYASAQSSSAGMATVGNATTLTSATSQPTAFCNRWPSYWSQTIYTAAELKAAGLSAGDITSMAYNITTLGDGATNANFTVSIATVGVNNFANTTFLTTGFATVFGPETYTHTATGWQTINFSTPYTWDGESNIVVEVKMSGADITNNSQTYYTATTGNTVLWQTSFTGSTTTGTLSTNRLNVMFGGQVACNSARVPVLATVNTPPVLTLSAATTTICNGETSSAITLTSNAADYDTYVWSPSAGVSGSALTGWSFDPSASTTYTLTASQTAGSMCVATATVDVTVNTTPSAVSIASVPAANCTNTAIALSATGGTIDVTATIGNATTLTGDTEQPTAFNNRWTNYTMQTIYTAAELNAMGIHAGKLNSLAFEVATLGSAATNSNLTIKIGTAAATSFANTTFVATTGFTTVYGPQTFTHTATGWQTLMFDAPYEWDGTSDILVNITMGGANSSNNTQTYYTQTTDNTVLWANSVSASTGTLSNKRLNARFTATNAAAITWSPTANLFTDAAATMPYVAGTNAAMVYVKSATAVNTTYTATSTSTLAGNCTASNTVDVNIADCGIVWGNLQWPASATITTCGTETAYGQVYKGGVTEAAGQGAGMMAWVGVSTTNTNPNTWAEADWHQATFNVQAGNNDEFKYDMTGLAAGTYYYAFRYQYQTGDFYYGGYNAGGGGAWDGTNNVSGVLTVNAVAAPAAAATQTFCNSATVANLATTAGTGIKWYADATGGTELAGTTALVDGENYFASQTVSGCESSARTEVVVTITNLTVTDPADVTVCNSYTLPALTTGNYFTATNGGGTQLTAGDQITTSQTIYVYATNGTCTAEQSFTVTVNNFTITIPSDVVACNSYTLPTLATGIYTSEANGQGDLIPAGTVIMATQTIYVYAENNTTPMCTATGSFTVTINTVAAPTGAAQQAINSDPADATIEDIVVNETGVLWFATEAEALAGTPALAAGTQITAGSTYWGILVDGSCFSAPLEVLITQVAGIRDVDGASFSYFPNPVKDVLNVKYSSDITSVEVFNMIGQKVLNKNINAAEGSVDMSQLADGTYIVNVTAGGAVKTIKVVKKQ